MAVANAAGWDGVYSQFQAQRHHRLLLGQTLGECGEEQDGVLWAKKHRRASPSTEGHSGDGRYLDIAFKAGDAIVADASVQARAALKRATTFRRVVRARRPWFSFTVSAASKYVA
jgi:hypothetical protein